MFSNYIYDPNEPTNRYSFEIKDVDLAIINSIRRIILSDVHIPGTIGEDNSTINIIVNDGPLHNEFIAHRIGLIPLFLKEDEIDNYVDNSIELELNVKNINSELLNVTTADIKGTRDDIEITKKELSEIFPQNKVTKNNILITRLRLNEQLHFKAKVVKKNGKFNSAFSPVCLSAFSFVTDPSKIDEKTSILDKERAYYTNKYGEPNLIKFELEPINIYIKPKYLINKAIEILIDKLNNLITNINDNDSTEVDIIKYNNSNNTFDFNINDEDDTLGNTIQSIIHNKFVRNEESIINNIKCSYCGYITPHPLKSLLVVRITLIDITDKNIFKQFLEYNCKSIIDMLQDIKNEWNKFID